MVRNDFIALSLSAVKGHRLRSFLSMLGIAIGVAAVILLTSIGEGTRRYILDQFSQFGTNVLAINPGKAKTMGIPGVLGGTTHKLTIDDAEALRRIPEVQKIVPLAFGQARVESGGKGRSVYVYGVTADMPDIWKIRVQYGSFIPVADPRRAQGVAALGPTLKRELFGKESALGKFVRIGDARFRVVGIMKPRGRMLGFDIDDCAYISVASSMKLFNMDELSEIDVLFSDTNSSDRVAKEVGRVLTERHGGNDDFTITTQAAMLDVFENVMNIVTMSVGGIAAISLVVGAIGIFTMMWITVRERTSEIGLIRALGGTPGQVRTLFLLEASMLGTLGGLSGVAIGLGISAILRGLVPGLPVFATPEYIAMALLTSLVTGLLSGVAPAHRASTLDPIEALRAD